MPKISNFGQLQSIEPNNNKFRVVNTLFLALYRTITKESNKNGKRKKLIVAQNVLATDWCVQQVACRASNAHARRILILFYFFCRCNEPQYLFSSLFFSFHFISLTLFSFLEKYILKWELNNISLWRTRKKNEDGQKDVCRAKIFACFARHQHLHRNLWWGARRWLGHMDTYLGIVILIYILIHFYDAVLWPESD